MKITVKKHIILPALQTVARAVSPRATLPVLANILLKADTDLTLSATNLELGITKTAAAEITEPGAITLPAKTLLDAINVMDGDISITVNPKNMSATITAGASTMKINGIDAEEFPLPRQSTGEPIIILASELRQAVSRTEFAVSPDESRPVLAGIEFGADGEGITLAATDGFRIAVSKFSCKSAPAHAIVPVKALQEAAKLPGDTINMTVCEGQVHFYTDDTRIISQLIDGNFPNYQQIIPKPSSSKTNMIIMTADLLRAVKQAMIVAREGNNTIRFDFVPEGDTAGRIKVSAQNESTGASETTLPAEIDGEPLSLAVNGAYMMQALNALGSFRVQFDMIAANAPIVITPVNDVNYQHVVMPMSLG